MDACVEQQELLMMVRKKDTLLFQNAVVLKDPPGSYLLTMSL